MSFHKSRFAGISATILVALFFLVFISLIIASKVILPDEIRSYIKGISKDTGYKIEIKKIEFDFFYGLRVGEIEIFDPLSPTNPILRVRNIAAKPSILSSLIKWKIKVQDIIIDNPIFSLTEEELDKLIKLTKEKEEERKRKKERPLPIEIEHLIITGSRIEFAPQILIRSKKIEIDLGDANLREERKVKLSGSINLQNKEIEIHGEIKPFLNTPTGELKMSLSDLNTQSFSDAIRLPEKLNIFLDSKFQVSDKITSQGVIDFRSIKSDGERISPFSGKFEYDLAYDSSTDTAMFDSLNLDIDELIHISFAGRIEKLRKEAIFKLEGRVETIQLENILQWFPSLSQIELSGDAKPNNIKIIGSRKDKNVSLTGKITLREFNIKDEKSGFRINGLEGGFDFEQNFGSRVPGGFFAQGDFSLRSLWIKTLNVNKVSGNIQFVPSGNEITLKSKGLYYKNLSFSKALVESGSVSRLEFSLGKNSDWTLNISSDGSQFKIPGEKIYIKQFKTDIHMRKNEGTIDVWGNLRGKKGRYMDTSFPTLSTDFEFDNDLLKLTNLKMAIETYGELRTEKLDLILQKPYTLTFTQGSFSGFNQGVKSKGIKGEFKFNGINRKKPMWDGNVFISEADIFKSQLKNLSFHINPSSDGISLKKISGRFLGGDLGGSVWIKTAGSPSLISSEIEFRKVVFPLSKIPISLGRVNFNFKGELRKGLLPQGSGIIKLSGLKLGQYNAVHPLSGQMEIQTIGETVILKRGFIENEKGVTVSFIGRIENSLNRSRSIQFDLSEVPVASIQEILFPILPGVLREGEVSGSTSLNLDLHPTEREIFWDGKLSLKDASFDGKLSSGVRFLVKNINGTIHLVEDIDVLENPLFITGYSKPDKKTFKASLKALTQDRIEQKGDILNVKEIEYGFLRLEDIEFALELGRDKLNLRRFESKLYGGNVFGTGLFEFGGKEHKYDLSFLVKDLSLKEASNSIPSTKDYITGRINGIGWLSDRGEKLSTLNGSFNLWAIKSKKESRTIGKALLTQLGVKERFLLRSSRRYDKGEVYGYIKDGVITFKELQILHSIFGIKDLLIQVDSKRNSISVSHFLSVIRETAKRASEGRLKIEIK